MTAPNVTVCAVVCMLLASTTAANAQDAETTCKQLGPQFRLKPKGAHDVVFFYPGDTANNHGTVEMNVDILPSGIVRKVDVVAPSGSKKFDAHAVEHIKRQWRWEPPIDPETGQPIEVCTAVKWSFDK